MHHEGNMTTYEEKKARRIERMRQRAARRRQEGEGRLAAADKISGAIPMGQPILVGHHSERRHRRDLERIRTNTTRGFEALDEARALERRADAAEESRAISSDDPEAIPKLRAQLAEAEADADHYAASVKAARPIVKDTPRAELAAALAAAVDHHGRALHPRVVAFVLTMGFLPTMANVRANVRRIKGRVGALEARSAEDPHADETFGDVRVTEEDNRVRILFPSKPSEQIRKALRAAGFLWAPTAGAWQRRASESAWYWARKILAPLAPPAPLGEVG